MRLDKWLKVSRLIKRRTVANEACDAARVTANGRPVKASYDVKVGDLLNLVQQSQWISEEYAQKTIQQFIADLQKDLSAEGLTLQAAALQNDAGLVGAVYYLLHH